MNYLKYAMWLEGKDDDCGTFIHALMSQQYPLDENYNK